MAVLFHMTARSMVVIDKLYDCRNHSWSSCFYPLSISYNETWRNQLAMIAASAMLFGQSSMPKLEVSLIFTLVKQSSIHVMSTALPSAIWSRRL